MRKYHRLTPEQADRWVLPAPNPDHFIDFQTLFGNNHPIEVEIGFGKGAFLVQSATNRSNINFFGLEHEKKYTFQTASRLARRNLNNCRVMPADGSKIITLNILPGTLSALHLYFPDPWWKTRHHKRRIITPAFLVSVAKCLGKEMPFHFATDVPEYFFSTLKLLEKNRHLSITSVWHSLEVPSGDSIVTNFERKAYSQGRTVHRFIALSTTCSS